MSKNTHIFVTKPEDMITDLDEVVRLGAHKMIRMALEAEIQAYLDSMGGNELPGGNRAVVRNGFHNEREITVGAGVVPVRVPRTRNRGPEDENFVSSLVPPYMRRSLKIDEAIPLLYLRGLSTGDFVPALEKLFGKGIRGISSANISRLRSIWNKDHKEWQRRDLSSKEYCYVWVDGIHFRVRIGEERLCVLVVIGATREGKKELISVVGGYRESEASWATLLRDLKSRGLKCPKLFIGDGALGFWKAVQDVFPEAKWQRCWVHKTANILDKVPKSVQPQAKSMIHEIYLAKTKKLAEKAYSAFIEHFDDKYPKATACLKKDREHLLTFYDFPAPHWRHVRTTNIIESPFSTVRLRTYKTRGHGNLQSTLVMVFKLLEQASMRWQKLNAVINISKVMQGIEFRDGKEYKKAA